MSFRPRRSALACAVIITMLAGPALPAVGAVLDGSEPMVARVDSAAQRSTAARVVGTTLPVPPSEGQRAAAEVVELVNAERAAAGRRPLAVHPAVTTAAVAHSADQAATGRMSHTGSDGSDGGTRLRRAGFAWTTWAENVASGQRTAADVVGAWMASPGHRANILDTTVTTIGVGLATSADGRTFWTLVLAA